MEIQKYSDFILNEARVNKAEVVNALTEMFKKKPHVEMDKLANERGLYGLAGMKKYLSGKYTTAAVDNALHDLKNDKKSGLKSVYVNVSHWGKSMPYWYMDLTEAEVKKLKEEYEEEEARKNKEELDKKSARKKSQHAASEAKKDAKEAAAKVRTAKKKASGKGVERKSGAPRKRTVAKKK
jgi:hypothetical protein